MIPIEWAAYQEGKRKQRKVISTGYMANERVRIGTTRVTVKWVWAIVLSLALVTSCNQSGRLDSIVNSRPECLPDSITSNGDSTITPAYAGIRGALLTSRFSSLEELKSVVRIEYFPNDSEEGRAYTGDSLVRLTHCSGGQTVVSILMKGVDEGDFSKAMRGDFSEKAGVGVQSPFSIVERQYLKRIIVLARRRPLFLGEGDPAFYDLALSMVDHIQNEDLAFVSPGDSSEKGYLNTFNHITAQAFITSLYSEKMADFVADVHERKTMPELMTGNFSSDQLSDPLVNPLDNYVDIVNNEWGQELGKELRTKYQIHSGTIWTPHLLASYLNDIQGYYRWALQIGMEPFRPQDTIVIRFAHKLNFAKSHAED